MPPTCNPPEWEALVARVVDESTRVDGHAPLNEDSLLGLSRDGLSGSKLYAEGDGFALVRNGALDLVVAPSSRGRGIGRQLLEAVPDVPLLAWSHGDHPAARRLAASHGFVAVRALWLMRRPGSPVAVEEAPVVIRTFEPADEPAFLAVNAAAFAAHPEQGRLSSEGLRARMAEPWFDATGFFLAERDDELLGYHWTKVHPDGSGEVYVIGISPAAQGLGLGRALLLRGLVHLQPRDVHLYVESDNLAAIRLYESIGFEHVATDVQYRR